MLVKQWSNNEVIISIIHKYLDKPLPWDFVFETMEIQNSYIQTYMLET